MCGLCTPRCQSRDHNSCHNYARALKFYCPHPWLRKNCNHVCGRCAEDTTSRWPAGQYGVLSRDKCPTGWFEFTHCMDNENDAGTTSATNFQMSPMSLKCDVTSTTFRYCFKGPSVPTRPGGFWTNSRYGGVAYVVRNILGGCGEFGSDGGTVEIDNEDDNNKNIYGNNGLNGKKWKQYHPFDFVFIPYSKTRLSFCRIGGKGTAQSPSSYIKVGSFNRQKFGFFIKPGQKCPVLMSPDGLLHGRREELLTFNENYLGNSKVLRGNPPVLLDKKMSTARWDVCQYNPQKAKTFNAWSVRNQN